MQCVAQIISPGLCSIGRPTSALSTSVFHFRQETQWRAPVTVPARHVIGARLAVLTAVGEARRRPALARDALMCPELRWPQACLSSDHASVELLEAQLHLTGASALPDRRRRTRICHLGGTGGQHGETCKQITKTKTKQKHSKGMQTQQTQLP
jgi:hypothetical protein